MEYINTQRQIEGWFWEHSLKKGATFKALQDSIEDWMKSAIPSFGRNRDLYLTLDFFETILSHGKKTCKEGEVPNRELSQLLLSVVESLFSYYRPSQLGLDEATVLRLWTLIKVLLPCTREEYIDQHYNLHKIFGSHFKQKLQRNGHCVENMSDFITRVWEGVQSVLRSTVNGMRMCLPPSALELLEENRVLSLSQDKTMQFLSESLTREHLTQMEQMHTLLNDIRKMPMAEEELIPGLHEGHSQDSLLRKVEALNLDLEAVDQQLEGSYQGLPEGERKPLAKHVAKLFEIKNLLEKLIKCHMPTLPQIQESQKMEVSRKGHVQDSELQLKEERLPVIRQDPSPSFSDASLSCPPAEPERESSKHNPCSPFDSVKAPKLQRRDFQDVVICLYESEVEVGGKRFQVFQ
ncbi:unnamed protein product [Darwinula stevensoni]|uniref:Uncharacterized protein n=1 Tax=Darwinula stevensoni TaxID=69355 RepID=A0A7R8WXZ3_9CRUS|nr:unnamed protein product [Darwinula stevensoni]CAG0878520.1 unnamed protein product [Darwinula stevensoni]